MEEKAEVMVEEKTEKIVLGIETSCDETGIALVRGTELLADVTASSMEQHVRYGGIIPEIASRAHLEAFLPTLEAALEKAEVKLEDVDAVAATAGPGIIGSLTIGITAAKALAFALKKPFYGINHIIGHAAVDCLVHGAIPERFVSLVVSGGHTTILVVDDIACKVRELGGTLDDAAGEAFDKVGRILGLPYPGGPHLDKLAQTGDKEAIVFPRGITTGKDKEKYRYDFSFSGVKTAVARYIEGIEARGEKIPSANIAAGFQESVADVLSKKALQACVDEGVDTLVVGGGFSANSRLRELITQRAEAMEITVRIPPIRYCTDNGAMMAALGAQVVSRGIAPSSLQISPDTALALETVQII